MTANSETHSKTIGYLLWIFGFMGAHAKETLRAVR